MITYNYDDMQSYSSASEFNDKYKIAYLFGEITKMLQEKLIKDFSITKSSLEEVFSTIAMRNRTTTILSRS